MPREIPIPYSPEMVRARRAGIKTNTRRVMKPQPLDGRPELAQHLARRGYFVWFNGGEEQRHWHCCPYGQPGDLLWVREAWRTLAIYNDLPPRDLPRDAPIWYEADGPAPAQFTGGRYRNALFMMRWMSRGLDEVVEIRVERLQDISEADAREEGVESYRAEHQIEPSPLGWSPVGAYRLLWEFINGPGSWSANPWVWVVKFKVLKP